MPWESRPDSVDTRRACLPSPRRLCDFATSVQRTSFPSLCTPPQSCKSAQHKYSQDSSRKACLSQHEGGYWTSNSWWEKQCARVFKCSTLRSAPRALLYGGYSPGNDSLSGSFCWDDRRSHGETGQSLTLGPSCLPQHRLHDKMESFCLHEQSWQMGQWKLKVLLALYTSPLPEGRRYD